MTGPQSARGTRTKRSEGTPARDERGREVNVGPARSMTGCDEYSDTAARSPVPAEHAGEVC